MPGEVAAEQGVTVTVLYTMASGPLTNRDAKALAEDARGNGVTLIKAKKIPLHGKFIAWDTDDVVITSMNWASASADPSFPAGEIGVHIHAPGIASHFIGELEKIFSELRSADV